MPKNDFMRKIIFLTPLSNLPKNVGDLGKLIFAKGFKKLPKVQKIAQSGHTAGSNNFSLISARPKRPMCGARSYKEKLTTLVLNNLIGYSNIGFQPIRMHKTSVA